MEKLITGNAPRGAMPRIMPEGNTVGEQSDFHAMAVQMVADGFGKFQQANLEMVSKIAFALNVGKKMAASAKEAFDAVQLRREVLITMARRGYPIFRDTVTPSDMSPTDAAGFIDGLLDEKGKPRAKIYLLPSILNLFAYAVKTDAAIQKHADKFAPCFDAKTYNGVMQAFLILARPYALAAYNQIKAEKAAKAAAKGEKSPVEKVTDYVTKAGLNRTDLALVIEMLNGMLGKAEDDADKGARLAILKAAQNAADAESEADAEEEEMAEAA